MPPQTALISGARILNGRTGSPGTLGFIGVGADGGLFLVSCYHVLGRLRGSSDPIGDREPIWQPGSESTSRMIGLTNRQMMHARFDIAAAELLPGVHASADIETLGPIRGMASPREGMRVLKYGAETGLTEGFITSVSGTLVEIEAGSDAGDEYRLADHGDSGALWVAPNGAAIAMHFQGSDGSRAFARPIEFVLSTLGLSLFREDA